MKLGMFMMPLHPVDRDLTQALREDLATVIHADRIGFDEMWVGEHAACLAEPIANPLIFLAAAIHQTKRIKLGTGVLNLPQHHPARAACEVALFDHMSEGRMLLGIGPGGLRSDFELFKTQDNVLRPQMALEAIDMMIRIWTQDPPYEIKGKFWDVSLKDTIVPEFGIGWMPKPFQKPHPPIAMSAMSAGSASVKFAASRGWGIISAPFIHTNQLKTHWTALQEGAASAGLKPSGAEWRCGRTIVVAPSDAEARDAAFDPKGQYFFYYDYLVRHMQHFGYIGIMKPEASIPDAEITTDGCIANRVIHGSPRRVAEQLIALRQEVGPFGGIVTSQHDWNGTDFEKRSMQLLAEEVMPIVRRAV
ncbi:MAG: LLM class flavin-dependent oxidoreductase [Alphaproteobacteria bacterium]|nr:LLM class flavin-dependent oxidoreductase [Alphaproteobacteria bacterium]